MKAVCPGCRRLAEARYVLGPTCVALSLVCPQDGVHSGEVSTDPEYFARGLALAGDAPQRAAGVIVEVLDGCNLRCPTCIAGSGPDLDNKRDPAAVGGHLSALGAAGRLPAVLLSGGEPTIHPQIHEFLSVVEAAGTRRRILITNGVRAAANPSYVRSLFRGHAVWEVFLQYDSRRARVLEDLRGGDLREVRSRALANLGDAGVPTTLVCVIKAGMNDDEIAELVDFAIAQPHVVGLQFQPMKQAGRADNYSRSQRGDAAAVRAALARYAGSAVVQPHPASPLSVGLARYDRASRTWAQPPLPAESEEYFIDPTRAPDRRLRVSVLEYADPEDWTSLRSGAPPYVVLQDDGTVRSVDDHFLAGEVAGLQYLPEAILTPT